MTGGQKGRGTTGHWHTGKLSRSVLAVPLAAFAFAPGYIPRKALSVHFALGKHSLLVAPKPWSHLLQVYQACPLHLLQNHQEPLRLLEVGKWLGSN